MKAPRKTYKVYCWTNKVNGKRYVGMTCQTMHKRAGAHMRNYRESPYFWAAIKKYGDTAFECKILVSGLTLKEAEQKERNYIKRYRTRNRLYGYNIQKGGTLSQTEATLEKQRKKSIRAVKNSPKAQAYHKKLSKQMKINVKDPAYRAAMSRGLKKMWEDPDIRARRITKIRQAWADPAMKAHILAARKATGRQCGPYKPVRVYCKELHKTFDTVSELEAAIGIQIKTVMRRALKSGHYTFVVGSRKGTPYTITRLKSKRHIRGH